MTEEKKNDDEQVEDKKLDEQKHKLTDAYQSLEKKEDEQDT